MTKVQAHDDIGNNRYQVVKIALGAEGQLAGLFGQGTTDSFGRQRVSNPATLFDSKLLHGKNSVFWDEVLAGGGTSVHSSENACITMTTSSNSDSVTRQTKMRFNYLPGKSQLILLTGVFGGTEEINIIVRKAGEDTVINQADWNIDTMDGSGPSGIDLDFTKTQIFFIDFEWLGVGTVRFGFVVDGQILYCHYKHNANLNSTVYMSSPNLPLRYSISNTSGTSTKYIGYGDANNGLFFRQVSTTNHTLTHICSSVISEGGQEATGYHRAFSNAGTHIDANATGTKYVMLGIRQQTGALDSVILPEKIRILGATNDNYRWFLTINPGLSGGSLSYSDITNSALQGAVGNGTIVATGDGTIIDEGYGVAANQFNASLNTALRIGSKIDGTRDELILIVQPLTSNADVYGALVWRELL